MQKQRRTPPKLTPPPYRGSGIEVVENLVEHAVPASRLRAVAAWHSERKAPRNAAIAARLLKAANDNSRT
ncbi:hypothetical protein J5277_09715 [Rhizobium sp. 16-449-1b]|uniref:hypothetical protein n=1 Tax=Rhizobium sp. 16-449-1b TaxID=2819989 RepID=UPI001ADD0463|nr:hypothetical protein [Rhizobium sp. 16-449-1b]MBO9194382.1 hypothetical protein [Rhizobium sp. 16-449-1b]